MKNRMFRTGMMALAVFAITILVGCAKEEANNAEADAAKINKNLEGMPPVPDDLATVSGKDPGAPLGKKGAPSGGGGP